MSAALFGAIAAGAHFRLQANGQSGGSTAIALYHTDLSDGPKTGGLNNSGVWVTLTGNFGAGPYTVTLGGGAVADITSSSPTKIVVQLGAAVSTGNFTVTNGAGQTTTGCIEKPAGTTNDFTVRAGNIKFIQASGTNGTGTHASPYTQALNRIRDNFSAGDIWYFRAGTYTQQLCVNGWGNNVLNLGGSYSGAAGAHTAFAAYPGEAVTLDISGDDPIYLRDDLETVSNYVSFAGFALRGVSSCVGGGAITSAGAQVANSGGQYMRLVDCDMQCSYTGNTQTGIVSIGGNGARMHGCTLHDTGYPTSATIGSTGFDPPYYNQNHGIYVQCGAGDVVISFNTLRNLNMGATVQVHTDRFFTYSGVHIRFNHFIVTTPTTHQMRGLVAGDISGDSTGSFVGNAMSGIGTDGGFSPIILYSGTWEIHNNTFYNAHPSAPIVLVSNAVSGDTNYVGIGTWSPPHIDVRNNILHCQAGGSYYGYGGGGSPGGLATSAQVTALNNLYSGAGSGPSYDTTRIDATPGMVSPGAEDYTLQAGSAAIDAGTSVALNAFALRDRLGLTRPQGAGIDIGAHERVA